VTIKAVVNRPRPPLADRLVVETNGSFPSGHTTVCYRRRRGGDVLLLLPRLARREQFVVGAGAIVVASWSVFRGLVLGVHWITDIAGGWGIGALVAVAIVLVATNVSPPRRRNLAE